MKNYLCIIPARGGSKRIPRKNALLLDGIPLICHTIRAAKEANIFHKIVVSTDDSELKQIARNEGVDVDDRPASMATDTATKVQVIKEYIERTKAQDNYENVVALLPTCPFRTSQDIREAVALFEKYPEENFLVGVTEYEFPIQLALKQTSSESVEMLDAEGYKTTRSQNIQKMYHPNGAIYLAKISSFMKIGTFFNQKMLSYQMPAIRSYDIDYPYQFAIAQEIAKMIRTEKNL